MRNLRRRLYGRHEESAPSDYTRGLQMHFTRHIHFATHFQARYPSIFPSKISHFEYCENRTGEIGNVPRIKDYNRWERARWFFTEHSLVCPTKQSARNSSHVFRGRRVNIPFLTSLKESFGESLRAAVGRDLRGSRAREVLHFRATCWKMTGGRRRSETQLARLFRARYCSRHSEYLRLRVISARSEILIISLRV